ncbi:MAG: hypothetical protein EBT51_08725 [Flavobacteriaceae bacterium]|nr:hypothetical protein [Flavobacteriaceae bacterium]
MNRKLEFDAQLRPTSKTFVPKAKIVSRKCKWANKGKNGELFFTVTMSVSKFIPGGNEETPTGFIDIKMGQYNTLKINTRDFVEFSEAVKTLYEFVNKHKGELNEVINTELDKYMEHQYKKLEMLKFLQK